MTPLPRKAVGNDPLIEFFNRLVEATRALTILETPTVKIKQRTARGITLKIVDL